MVGEGTQTRIGGDIIQTKRWEVSSSDGSRFSGRELLFSLNYYVGEVP